MERTLVGVGLGRGRRRRKVRHEFRRAATARVLVDLQTAGRKAAVRSVSELERGNWEVRSRGSLTSMDFVSRPYLWDAAAREAQSQ